MAAAIEALEGALRAGLDPEQDGERTALVAPTDGAGLHPVALLDGAALTSLRIPAVSGLAVRHLSAPGSSRLALFGTGVQAWGHVLASRTSMLIRLVISGVTSTACVPSTCGPA
jgi:ornithine cyclodeaminase/alanine dehydrogenase-like protein (mu-crystallin family)